MFKIPLKRGRLVGILRKHKVEEELSKNPYTVKYRKKLEAIGTFKGKVTAIKKADNKNELYYVNKIKKTTKY